MDTQQYMKAAIGQALEIITAHTLLSITMMKLEEIPVLHAPNEQRTLTAVATVGMMAVDQFEQRIGAKLEQAARLLARDIASDVRSVDDGPIFWLTGNSMMPPIRNFDQVERLWQSSDDTGRWWDLFNQCFEQACDEQGIYVGCPEYDNSLYAVDLRIWVAACHEGDAETLADEWTKINKENAA